MTPEERNSIGATLGLSIASLGVGLVGALMNQPLWLGLATGALGGLVHEIAQSKGRILFFKRAPDGLYLGSIAGMVMGAVAGILIVRGGLESGTSADLAIETFLAGLALKGVTEAAAGTDTPEELTLKAQGGAEEADPPAAPTARPVSVATPSRAKQKHQV